MRVLFLANDWFALYNYRKELIIELIKKGYEVFACVIDDENNRKLEELGAKVICVDMDRRGVNPVHDYNVYKKYCKIIKEIKPNLVISYTIKACIYGGWAAKKYKTPFIATITGLGTAFQKGFILKKLVINMYKKAFKKAKFVFFQNDENMNIFLDNNIIKKEQVIRVNGSGVDLNRFNYIEYPKKDEVNLIYVSRIFKEKGIDEYIKAAEYFNERDKKIRFHIFGTCVDKVYEDWLRALNDEGIIIYHGQQNDMMKFQEISNATVHPTYYPEGMSNVLLESCACGRPIITTTVCGCKEIIEDGVNGFIAKQNNADDLIRVIQKFIDLTLLEKISMGKKAREKIESEFDRGKVIKKYIEKINSILGE